MVASVGVITSPSQGASYFEKDGYYAKVDAALGLAGPSILEGRVPDGPHLGKRGKDGEIHHRHGRDVTLSAPKSVSLMEMVSSDGRIVDVHNLTVG